MRLRDTRFTGEVESHPATLGMRLRDTRFTGEVGSNHATLGMRLRDTRFTGHETTWHQVYRWGRVKPRDTGHDTAWHQVYRAWDYVTPGLQVRSSHTTRHLHAPTLRLTSACMYVLRACSAR